MIQRFSAPSRSERNAICLPSGENRGCESNAMPVEIALASPPPMGNNQISPASSKTICAPSGETSSEIQVPSSVSNAIFRSGFRGRPAVSAFGAAGFS